jgi:uroporphyrinogen-III synthase
VTPLEGKRIVITRPSHQSAPLIERLRTLGAVPIAFPTIRIAAQTENEALGRAIAGLEGYDWLIFTSRNGVEVFWEHFEQAGADAQRLRGRRIAAIGPATAAALADRNTPVELVPPEYVAESILDVIGDVRGLRILLPRAEIARPVLAEELARRGAQVDEIPVYQTLPGQPDAQAWEQLRAGVDVITFTSSSTVRSFIELTGAEAHHLLSGAVLACIGPITAGTLREYGYSPRVVAQEFTTEGLVRALIEFYEK